MLSNHIDNIPSDIPLWLKELRLRKRNKQLQQQHSNQSPTAESPQTSSSPFFGSSTSSSVTLGGTAVQQPSSTTRCHTVFSAVTNGGDSSDIPVAVNNDGERVTCVSSSNNGKMVQERPWIDHADHLIESIETNNDSDSSEELKYGPGIVSKLKNRYLNLTLREASSKTRPSILNLRKATSLEHIIDDYDIHEDKPHDNKTERLFQRHAGNKNTGNANRYHARNATRSDMKRARSVEIISDLDHDSLLTNSNDEKAKQRESLHEEMLVIEGNDDKTYNTTVDKQKTLQIEDSMNFSNSIGLRLNRPKKLQPVMDEKEKPHSDIVKEKKRLFERAESRTKAPQTTGDVAAKVAGFKTIIDSTKANRKKPPIKQKPHIEKPPKIERPNPQLKHDNSFEKPHEIGSPIPPLRSPVKECKLEPKQATTASLPTQPDVSKVSSPLDEINGFVNSSLSETPDLIVHSSHHLRTEQIENFIKAEKEHGIVEEKNRINLEKSKDFDLERTPTENQKTLGSHSIIYTFSSPTKIKNHLPKIDSNRMKRETETLTEIPNSTKSNHKEKLSPTKKAGSSKTKSTLNHQKANCTDGVVIGESSKPSSSIRQSLFPKEESVIVNSTSGNTVPITEQLKVEIADNNIEPKGNKIPNKQKPSESSLLKKHSLPSSPSKVKVAPPVPQQKDPNKKVIVSDSKNGSKLSNKVIEKNLINKLNGNVSTDKSENSAEKIVKEVPIIRKRLAPKKEQQNSLVFDFTGRKDVPDYVGNDGSIKPKEKIRPKPGEGGIIILPGATLDETLVDSDEEDWKRLLECPPSPCNVTFTNDNVLIEGRSSLKKLKKPKMTIRFIDTRPEIFEYPSETSLLEDNSHTVTTLTNSGSMGHTVPSLSGSSLGNYTPKSAFQADEFQLGLKPSLQSTPNAVEPTKQTDDTLEESVILQETPIQFSAGTNSDILF